MADGARSGGGSLLYPLVLLLATAAALGAVALLDGRPPAEADGQGDPVALAEVAIELAPQVARRVERMRELRFEAVPVPRVVSAEYLSEFAQEEAERRQDDPEAELASDEAMARMVGLLDEDEDLRTLGEEPGELAAAAWDPRRDRLYVVADAVAESPALVEFLLAHELTHALEDQAFGLPHPADARGDRSLARAALVEGTATALMMEYARHYIDQLALGLATLGLGQGPVDLPRFAVEQSQWVYLGGQEFVEHLHRREGGWELIDEALDRRPPASTAQVLDPEKYVRDERPLEVEIESEALREEGWRRVDAGTVGELVTRQILAVGIGPGGAEAVEGWRGDRYELWADEVDPAQCVHPCRAELVLALRWRWREPADARRFEALARRYLERGLDGEPAGDGQWAVEGGRMALGSRGLESTLTFAPRPELAEAAAGGG